MPPSADRHLDQAQRPAARPLAWAAAAGFSAAFFRYALRPALIRAVPIYVITILIGHLMLKAVPLHRAVSGLPLLLPLLASIWALALSHARRPLFGARQTDYLRSLPTPNAVLSATVIVSLLLLDTPWLLLCLASGDPGVAVGGPLAAGTVHTAVGSGRRMALVSSLVLLGLASWLSPWLLALTALLLTARLAPLAWNVTRTGRVTWRRGLYLPVPWLAVARALLTGVVATAPQLLRRGAIILAVMIGVAGLAVRNNDFRSLESILTVNLIVLGVGLPFLIARVTVGILEKGWALGWLYEATGTTRRTRTLGGLALVAFLGTSLGAVHALAVAAVSERSLAGPLAAAEGAAGGGLAIVLLGLTAAAVRKGAIDPGWQGTGLAIASILVPLIAGSGGWVVILVGLPALGGAIFLYHARVSRASA